MNTQNLSPNALSIAQTHQVKGGVSPSELYSYAQKGYAVGKWGYDHRRQIVSAAKCTYSVGRKTYNYVKSWF